MAKKQGKRGNNEGTICKRKSGGWEGKITIGIDPNTGKPKRRTFYGKTQKEVKEKIEKAKSDILTGIYVEPQKLTIEMWLNRYLDTFIKPNLKPASYANYKDLLKNHINPSIGKVELQKFTTDILQQFYNQKSISGRLDGKDGGLSSRIIRMMHQVIGRALKQAVKQHLIPFNPAEAVTLPKLKYKEITPFNKNEVKQYLSAAQDNRLYAAFLLDLTTGLRRGELLALQWDDIDIDKRILAIKRTLSRVRLVDDGISKLMVGEPKTEKGKRVIPLLPEIIEELKGHKVRQAKERLKKGEQYENNDLVFCTPEGKYIEPRNFHRIHTAILEKAELRHVRIHDLRHTFATILLEAGEDPKTMSELLGHAKVSTTLDIYCHSSIEMKEQTVSKLGGLIFNIGTVAKK